MIEELNKNIDTEIEILREISEYTGRMEFATDSEKKILEEAINSLTASIKIINDSIPKLVINVSAATKLPSKKTETGLEKIKFKRENTRLFVTLQKKDREKFLQELSFGESLVRKLKRKESKFVDKAEEFKAARGYLKLSNKVFLKKTISLIEKGRFKSLALELKKANIDILFEVYVSMMFFTTLLVFCVSVIIFIMLMATDLTLARFAKVFWIPLALPAITFFILYVYPSTEKSSLAKRIEHELPFAVIHMSAISGSGIEPTEIFKIIGLSREYPFLRKEIRKVLNQINLYGYDLVTALNNSAKNNPSPKLGELFAGLSTTISSGGSLPEYFNKRAENLLLDYRLEREKYTHTAETFMDIYISVVIAAPMILMLLLIMISVSGFQVGFSPGQITFVIILIIALINIVFIGVLQAKQPIY